MHKEELFKRLEGVHTLQSVMSVLGISRPQAVYYIHRLRKAGYVKTARFPSGNRIYSISFENKLGGTSYEELLNKISPIKLAVGVIHRFYGKTPTPEEILVYAVKRDSLRTILSALVLFKKVIDWDVLYRISKGNYCERQIGALYDLARTIMRTRRMSGRFRNLSLPKKEYAFRYLIPGLKSKDFKEIENRWRVYLPFNKSDLEAYA
ncbi:hypothetical protein HYV79_00910 [Candidatus Woesearchaeota archaeon]|nr:hypothetical protein [Candidatus Woesearchaeota archaeon]